MSLWSEIWRKPRIKLQKGGFVIIRHDNIVKFEANLLNVVCNDVQVEPELQSINDETIEGLTGDNARPDIRARSFWRHGQNAYFDVRITNVNSKSQTNIEPKKILKGHETEKKRLYNRRIMNVEHGTFTPLVFSLTGGEGPETAVFHKHVAAKIAEKTGDRYDHVLSLIRVKLSFLILRSALLCLRGSRSINPAVVEAGEFGLTLSEAGLG